MTESVVPYHYLPDDYHVAERIAKTHKCPDCPKSKLAVLHKDGRDTAWCPKCGRTEGFRGRETLTQMWKRDPGAVPLSIANRLEQKHGGVSPMTSTELALASEKTLMERMETSRWTAQMPAQDKRALAQLAVAYHLDPVMGELILYEGKPYIPLAGMIRKAHDSKGFEGIEDRPMSQDERDAYGIKQPIGWIAKVYRRGFRVPTVGTGAADPEKPFRNNPVERERPQWMARSRAIRQALRLAFPHSLPFDAVESAEEAGIDPETGEIFDRPETIEVIGQEDIETTTVEPEPEEQRPAMVYPRSELAQKFEALVFRAKEFGLAIPTLNIPCSEETAMITCKELADQIKKAKAVKAKEEMF